MEDNICEEIAIKIDWFYDTYYADDGIRKFKDTGLPLNGKYKDEDEKHIRYFKNGKKHNENGPAHIGKDGYKAYLINGKRHRIDGPAVIYSDGDYEWYINGHQVSNETISIWLEENDIPLDWNMWSNEDKMLFALHWSDYSE